MLSSFLDSGLANAVCATIAPSAMGVNRGIGAFQYVGCTEGRNDVSSPPQCYLLPLGKRCNTTSKSLK
jgi:hypothetical protein